VLRVVRGRTTYEEAPLAKRPVPGYDILQPTTAPRAVRGDCVRGSSGRERMALEKNEQRPPVVFISYSHDSPEHMDRVLTLSNHLRQDGLDCLIDQYEESPPEGWPRWMDNRIGEADFVLLICTQCYYDRVMDREQPGVGKGVRWESTLAYQHVYDAGTKNAKFIPVLFQDGQEVHIPTPFKGATHYSVDAKDGYELLYRRLTNQPRVRKPGLGKLKKLPPVESRSKKQDFASPVQGSWPGISLPRGGPKVSEPFAGREEELKELTTALTGAFNLSPEFPMLAVVCPCVLGTIDVTCPMCENATTVEAQVFLSLRQRL